MLRRRSSERPRSGSAAVELAVCLPLLLGMMLGVWEVGRMVEVQQLLANAVREGGRQASTGIKSSADVKQYVVNYLNTNGITGVSVNDVTVQNLTNKGATDPRDAEQMDQLRVSVSIPVDSVRFVLVAQVTSVRTLSAQADWVCMKDIPITVNTTIPVD